MILNYLFLISVNHSINFNKLYDKSIYLKNKHQIIHYDLPLTSPSVSGYSAS